FTDEHGTCATFLLSPVPMRWGWVPGKPRGSWHTRWQVWQAGVAPETIELLGNGSSLEPGLSTLESVSPLVNTEKRRRYREARPLLEARRALRFGVVKNFSSMRTPFASQTIRAKRGLIMKRSALPALVLIFVAWAASACTEGVEPTTPESRQGADEPILGA